VSTLFFSLVELYGNRQWPVSHMEATPSVLSEIGKFCRNTPIYWVAVDSCMTRLFTVSCALLAETQVLPNRIFSMKNEFRFQLPTEKNFPEFFCIVYMFCGIFYMHDNYIFSSYKFKYLWCPLFKRT
jgi:hypothetical protein